MQLYRSSDNLVWAFELRDATAGDGVVWITDATVSGRVLSDDGNETVIVNSFSMTYFSGGAVTVDGHPHDGGNYSGQIPSSATLVDGTRYILEVVATKSGKTTTGRVALYARYLSGKVM